MPVYCLKITVPVGWALSTVLMLYRHWLHRRQSHHYSFLVLAVMCKSGQEWTPPPWSGKQNIEQVGEDWHTARPSCLPYDPSGQGNEVRWGDVHLEVPQFPSDFDTRSSRLEQSRSPYYWGCDLHTVAMYAAPSVGTLLRAFTFSSGFCPSLAVRMLHCDHFWSPVLVRLAAVPALPAS